MARSVATIQAQILSFFAANNNLSYQDEYNITRNITYNNSKRAIWNLLAFIVAVCLAIMEQLLNLLTTDIQTQVAQSAAASALWIQAKMFAFQYDENDPQIIQLINLVPQYAAVDPSLQIITACNVTIDPSNVVHIKVATGDPLQPINANQLLAAQAYINLLGHAGINYNVTSQPPDRIYIQAQIFFNGQYSSVIQPNVTAAIQNFLQDLSLNNFNGVLKVSDLEGCIRTVSGVNDVVLNNVSCRQGVNNYSAAAAYSPGMLVCYEGGIYQNITPISLPGQSWNYLNWTFIIPALSFETTSLVSNNRLKDYEYQPLAGYVISEDVTGFTANAWQQYTWYNPGDLILSPDIPGGTVWECINRTIGYTLSFQPGFDWLPLGSSYGDQTLNSSLTFIAE